MMLKPQALLLVLFCSLALVAVLAIQAEQPSAQVKEICDNKIDDDGDKLVDCEDPDCDCSPPQEICDNKIDDDGDKLVDCEDPDCDCTPPEGQGCSPGYWKNHLDEFYSYCGQVPGWTCDELLTALTCRGSDASCRRQEAAAAMNAVSGCTE